MNENLVSSKFPRALYIELTDRCNLSCPMCRSAGFKGSVLPFETYIEIAKNLFPHASFIDLRGWGESTTLKNFEDYLDVALKYGKKIKLITNAAINRPKLWEKLGESGVLVGVSFDASDEATFAAIRGGASMEKVIRNLKILAEAYQTHQGNVADYLYFCITASGTNLSHLSRIIEIGRSLGINHFKIEPLKTNKEDTDNLFYHKEKVRSVLQDLAALVKEDSALKIELSASLTEETTILQKTKKVCIHPFDYLYVNSKGGLGFCDHLNGVEEFVWGQWDGIEGFQKFWNGDKMIQFRKEHEKVLKGEKIVSCEDCNWCYERRYADQEYLVDEDWKNYSEFIK